MTSTNVNIINPGKLWIDNRCYRLLNYESTGFKNYEAEDSYPDECVYQDDLDYSLDNDIEVEYLNNGKIRSSFVVASAYMSYLIGAKGATKRRVENDTHTQIKIPSKGQIGDVGKDVKSVRQAHLKLRLLIDQVKKKQPFTHFVSIPFNSSSLQESFLQFKKDVLEKCGNNRGIDPSIFQKPEILHMTICMLVLADDRERNEAVEAFKNCYKEIMENYICGEPIRVEVNGIEYMNDDPSEVSVLYGKINNVSWNVSLQELADAIATRLFKEDVAIKQRDQIKMHVTLMNSKFRESEKEDNEITKRETFDARQILEEFKNFYFGEVEVSELHLSIRHSFTSSGYYSASCKLPLSSS